MAASGRRYRLAWFETLLNDRQLLLGCPPPAANITRQQFNMSILVRHKPVLKPVLEPFCLCRLSGRKGVQFKRRFRVSVRLPRARSLRRSLMRHSLNPDGKWQPGLGLCHDKIRVAVRRSWDGSANKAIPMCASFLS